MAHSSDGSDWSVVYGIQADIFQPESDPEQDSSPAEAVEVPLVPWKTVCVAKTPNTLYVHHLCDNKSNSVSKVPPCVGGFLQSVG